MNELIHITGKILKKKTNVRLTIHFETFSTLQTFFLQIKLKFGRSVPK